MKLCGDYRFALKVDAASLDLFLGLFSSVCCLEVKRMKPTLALPLK